MKKIMIIFGIIVLMIVLFGLIKIVTSETDCNNLWEFNKPKEEIQKSIYDAYWDGDLTKESIIKMKRCGCMVRRVVGNTPYLFANKVPINRRLIC